MELEPEGQVLKQYHSWSITERIVNYRPQQNNHQQERTTKDRPQEEKMYTVSLTRNQ